MQKRRQFLQQMTAFGLGSPFLFPKLDKILAAAENRSPKELARDEAFWAQVRSGYRLKPDYINLENGYYCFLPQETLENYIHHIRQVNYQGSYYMRTVQWDNKRYVAEQLAELADCDPEEVGITRNTTESLDLIIGGQHWEAGDEAVMAEQDYGAMLDMFELQARRHGVVNKRVSLPNHPTSDADIVNLYANAITDKTKLLMVCHLVNITGQILPIKKIVDMAHAKGVDVMVDGAHALGHIQFSMRDLGCDYYGASLHKWLSAPLGSGFLFVKKEKIAGVWPLFAEINRQPDDIQRLNHTGTHPVATDLAILNALEYHHRLGGERKEARLRYIQQYWTSKLRETSRVVINTPEDPKRSCAIANVGIEGLAPSDLAKKLMAEHRVWTVAINRPGVRGCRITPNVYTTTKELDKFVAAIKSIAAEV
ncbi:MAG TPA: aminotransferase class V-fold PLP-dependent enzyme [Saprospiraceae bacterium]|nr:aminotransferase class V-fold PLP-dependent enzyme [Saprospiraceae bacterium]